MNAEPRGLKEAPASSRPAEGVQHLRTGNGQPDRPKAMCFCKTAAVQLSSRPSDLAHVFSSNGKQNEKPDNLLWIG